MGRKKDGTFEKGFTGNIHGRPRKDAVENPSLATRTDGWASALTGLGVVGVDKRLGHQFYATTLSYQDSISLWLQNDLAAKAVEAIPRECNREGFDIVIADEGSYDSLKEDLEEEFERLEVTKHVTRAWNLERALGGSALLLGTNDGDNFESPMSSNISSLDWISVLEPIEITPHKYYADPRSPKDGSPGLAGKDGSGLVTAIGPPVAAGSGHDVYLDAKSGDVYQWR